MLSRMLGVMAHWREAMSMQNTTILEGNFDLNNS